MRRRRNRSTEKKKPKLEFEESPVSILHNPPSPVYCSDFPATADVVPIHNLGFPWVDSEFPHNIKLNPRRTRLQRQKSQTESTVCATKRPVYNPLAFLGETNSTEESIVTDITYQDDIDAVLVNPEATPTSKTTKMRTKKLKDVTPPTADHSTQHQFVTPPDAGVRNLPGNDSGSKLNNILNGASPSLATVLPQKRLHAVDLPVQGLRDGVTRSRAATRDSMDTTQSRERLVKKKRLFSRDANSSDDLTDIYQIKNRNVKSDMPDASQDLENVQDDTSERLGLFKNDVINDHLFSPLLCKTQDCRTPSRTINSNVLVFDTPEEDYGLPVRLRRAKYLRNKTNM